MVKFRKFGSPAFNEGERWFGVAGNAVTILSKARHANLTGKWDWRVSYLQIDGTVASKDGWSFQVRYGHESDQKKS